MKLQDIHIQVLIALTHQKMSSSVENIFFN